MTEKLIGQAKREMIGNDIFSDFHMYDFKALVASGGYRFVDEYGKERDVEEVFGE